ncbi:DUF397 domain-containing protein [Streptomyces sp. NPDC050617]|uniref:DUF397 domain-containing protein n=1 Tax=Streptomyces sp. NPDC050617 TaxID=3154628 RepID=UPI00343F0A07
MTTNSAPTWVKSTYSSPDGGNCVEWAPSSVATRGVVPVRDSKDPHGPALVFNTAAWSNFVAFIRTTDA